MMSKLVAKKPKAEKVSLSFPLSSLPEEVALSCLVRVSRSDLAALSLVSKKYQSLVASPEFYKLRSQLGYATYTRFYVCLSTSRDSTPSWYMFSNEKAKSRSIMSPFQPPEGSSVVALDREIYVIGGLVNEKPTSDVLRLDCQTHTWHQVPSMGVARDSAAAGVVDGKIYVLGGGKNSPLSYYEVFDLQTQTWDTLTPLPDSYNGYTCLEAERIRLVMDDSVYAVKGSHAVLYYSPNEGEWGRINIPGLPMLGIKSYCCATNNLLYGCDSYGNVYWSELSEMLEWKKVKGLAFLHTMFPKPYTDIRFRSFHELFKRSSKLRKFGMNIVLIWFKDSDKGNQADIWCAEISFKRCKKKDEIWGTIEWLENVASMDGHSSSDLEVFNSVIVNL